MVLLYEGHTWHNYSYSAKQHHPGFCHIFTMYLRTEIYLYKPPKSGQQPCDPIPLA